MEEDYHKLYSLLQEQDESVQEEPFDFKAYTNNRPEDGTPYVSVYDRNKKDYVSTGGKGTWRDFFDYDKPDRD